MHGRYSLRLSQLTDDDETESLAEILQKCPGSVNHDTALPMLANCEVPEVLQMQQLAGTEILGYSLSRRAYSR